MAVGRNVTTGFFALPIICLGRGYNSRTDPANTKPGRYEPTDQLVAFPRKPLIIRPSQPAHQRAEVGPALGVYVGADDLRAV